MRRPTGDGNGTDLGAVSGTPLDRWADAAEDEGSENEGDDVAYDDEDVEGVEEAEIQSPKEGVMSDVVQPDAVASGFSKEGVSSAGAIDKSAQQRLPLVQAGVDVMNQGAESSGRNFTSSPRESPTNIHCRPWRSSPSLEIPTCGSISISPIELTMSVTLLIASATCTAFHRTSFSSTCYNSRFLVCKNSFAKPQGTRPPPSNNIFSAIDKQSTCCLKPLAEKTIVAVCLQGSILGG
ncbi:hypothetical protein NE237_025930 [Protea cynaroides]|uniref:Uncharacterized protein n=1 Tax=Protea cynaroides TaxID=273540 RepID=A0A9Q0K008_9MAGN|nr:hypothetical protein NE237_025930 [Protea cynaroides]